MMRRRRRRRRWWWLNWVLNSDRVRRFCRQAGSEFQTDGATKLNEASIAERFEIMFRKFQKLLPWGWEGACDVWYVQSEAGVWGVVYTVQVTVAYKLQALVYGILARRVGSLRKSCRMWSQESFTDSNAVHLTVVKVNVLLTFTRLFAHDNFIML